MTVVTAVEFSATLTPAVAPAPFDVIVGAAGGTGVTVTEIASRWGFNHLGRFSSVYLHRFGEAPSHTLRS